jgi:hypothetical protein
MPVLHVRALPPLGGDEQLDRALRGIAVDVSAVLGADPRGTWCTFTVLDRQSIGEEVVGPDRQIVYLDLWIRSRGQELEGRALAAACGAAARELGVPLEDVWGTLRHVEPGRVFAGGGPIED